jgi:hypothetical protein
VTALFGRPKRDDELIRLRAPQGFKDRDQFAVVPNRVEWQFVKTVKSQFFETVKSQFNNIRDFARTRARNLHLGKTLRADGNANTHRAITQRPTASLRLCSCASLWRYFRS